MTETGFEQQCPCGATITISGGYKDGMAAQINSWNNIHDGHNDNVTFEEVSAVNAKRANRWHPEFPGHKDGWTGADWSNAAAGEGGEMLDALQALLLANGAAAHLGLAGNVVKKLRRLDTHLQQAEQGDEKDEAYAAMLKQKLATEIGDTFIYLDLLATFYGLSMETCVVDTFNRVSVRENFPEKIDGKGR